ncbi:hypothetical protein E4U13_005620 [Claviceps humidiphila]|uniref:tRNA(Phe) 7-[(3-amino-3-carboxypropyl)-4-demethylwyosine(37)-N(4)]-methyltransferase n=1 Tax=Claviceps humidiphila TaxID=1294629 RepID=A0A9P7PY89_9HYPO|nr:hypothetical protein E4U13_005620 [Claviceps humidiphila]
MPQLPFPKPPPGFEAKKARILHDLAVPAAEYTDASPKGTIDTGIRDLIDEINTAEGFVTTSSCAGRVSVFLEGRKVALAADGHGEAAEAHAGASSGSASQVAGVGGKGAGGTWLFVSHDVVEGQDWVDGLALMRGNAEETETETEEGRRLIHFKFEPMILHILTASPSHAQVLLQAALQAGFRESGAVNIAPQADSSTTPMVAVRSMGLSFESLIGFESSRSGSRHALVTASHLRLLMGIARERFAENSKRIERFRGAFASRVLESREKRTTSDGREWEDAAARRERMREEGLRRREALRGADGEMSTGVCND